MSSEIGLPTKAFPPGHLHQELMERCHFLGVGFIVRLQMGMRNRNMSKQMATKKVISFKPWILQDSQGHVTRLSLNGEIKTLMKRERGLVIWVKWPPTQVVNLSCGDELD